jgi:hypothetical protein
MPDHRRRDRGRVPIEFQQAHLGIQAAVSRQCRSSDKSGVGAEQKGDEAGDLVISAEAPKRYLLP